MINPLTQSWRVNLDSTTLPASLKRMMRTAYKYGVKLVPFGVNQTIRRRMPYWFHWANKPKLESQYYDMWGKCQRLNHNIKYVGEMLDHANKTGAFGCRNKPSCVCPSCDRDRQTGCKNPTACRKNAHAKLNNIEPEWDPRKFAAEAEEAPGDDDLDPLDDSYTKAWRPGQTLTHPGQLVRIFTSEEKKPRAGQREQAPQPARAPTTPDVELYTDGSCVNNGTADARCGSGVWYGEDDPRNQALRVDLPEQSNNVGELVAVLAA
ncbi:hypothetical protein DFP72DRAFT_817405, partial [Ephemerocybe angulata]